MILAGKNKESFLARRMSALGIREEQLQERFVRSSSPGGQNVNKVSSCVYLKHLPTGITVKCQIERQQWQNRYLARKILLEKLAQRKQRQIDQARMCRQKQRRQNRRRSAAQKLKILENKRRQGLKKNLRRKIHEIEVA